MYMTIPTYEHLNTLIPTPVGTTQWDHFEIKFLRIFTTFLPLCHIFHLVHFQLPKFPTYPSTSRRQWILLDCKNQFSCSFRAFQLTPYSIDCLSITSLIVISPTVKHLHVSFHPSKISLIWSASLWFTHWNVNCPLCSMSPKFHWYSRFAYDFSTILSSFIPRPSPTPEIPQISTDFALIMNLNGRRNSFHCAVRNFATIFNLRTLPCSTGSEWFSRFYGVLWEAANYWSTYRRMSMTYRMNSLFSVSGWVGRYPVELYAIYLSEIQWLFYSVESIASRYRLNIISNNNI